VLNHLGQSLVCQLLDFFNKFHLLLDTDVPIMIKIISDSYSSSSSSPSDLSSAAEGFFLASALDLGAATGFLGAGGGASCWMPFAARNF
jgi:hypothetical protein